MSSIYTLLGQINSACVLAHAIQEDRAEAGKREEAAALDRLADDLAGISMDIRRLLESVPNEPKADPFLPRTTLDITDDMIRETNERR